MSTENFPSELCLDETECQPNKTVSSTVVTRRNQKVHTQNIVTSRKLVSNSYTRELADSIPEGKTVPIHETSVISRNEGATTTVRTTRKTYSKRIICRTGADGEVTEEIIEEGDPIESELISLPQTSLKSEDSLLPIRSSSSENMHKMSSSGATNFQAMAAFKSISNTGEEHTSNFSTGQIKTQFLTPEQQMIENNDGNISEDTKRPSSQNSFPDNIPEVMPDGSTFTSKFFSSQSATVTHSSTVNGETKTSSKSAFMCYTGENVLQANSTMNDMEAIFNEMTTQLKMEGFDVLNRFILSSGSNVTDHLALAGGNSGISLLAIESPGITDNIDELQLKSKPVRYKVGHEPVQDYPIHEHKSLESIRKVEEQQQEEIKQRIISSIEQKSSNRLYWSNMDEVKSSGIVNNMRTEEIHLQEGIFEIITSEASYNISLDILIDFYYKNELLNPNRENAVINSVEKHHLFSNILLVKGVSLQFLKDLENRWSQNKPKILDLADIILKHAENEEFEQQYVNYLANQSFQIKSLRNLMQRESFKLALLTIQNNPKCCKLSLDSFLALPMQRLTRLKLLLDVVMKLMNRSEDLYSSIPASVILNHENALRKVKELLTKSESKKFEMDQKARLIDVWNMLDFGNGCKKVAFGSNELIKEGEVRAHVPQIYPNALKKLSKKRQPSFYLIVLSDLVIIAKMKTATKFLVLDYCDRGLVEATIKVPSSPQPPRQKLNRDRSNGSQAFSSFPISREPSDNVTQVGAGQMFILKFLKSESDVLTEPLLLNTSSIESRDKWILAIMSK